MKCIQIPDTHLVAPCNSPVGSASGSGLTPSSLISMPITVTPNARKVM